VPDNRLPFGPEPGDVFVSDEDAENAEFVVCVFPHEVAPEYAASAIEGRCSRCGAAVTFQPHAPRRPPKLCRPCAREFIGNQEVLRVWTKRIAGD
jgi:hypothetical protein